MPNGATKDLKGVIVTIISDNEKFEIPSDLYGESPEFANETNKWEATPGNGGGHEFQRVYNADGTYTISLFKRDKFFTIEQMYNEGVTIDFLVKDTNTNRSLFQSSTKIGNIDSYTQGSTDPVSVTFLMPSPQFS